MPNGSLTPLGRQLRSVLALDRPRAVSRSLLFSRARAYHSATHVDTLAKDGAQSNAPKRGRTSPNDPIHAVFQEHRDQELRRERRRDYLGKALSASGARGSVPRPQRGKLDYSFANPRIQSPLRLIKKDVIRKRLRDKSKPRQSRATSISKALAHYIEKAGKTSATVALRNRDAEFLLRKGYEPSHVEGWASALTSQDSLEAAKMLEHQAQSRGSQAVPFVVYMYLLRRPYIKAAALRILVWQLQVYLSARFSERDPPAAGAQMLFMTFMRLLRHAREVWPQVTPYLTEMFLDRVTYLERRSRMTIEDKTSMSNKAMELLSRSCAIQPMKNAVYMVPALFDVLRFMAEHDSPILLTRSGYRAVVRVQLADKKTATERQWATLKALSWPPWKVDRTGKDSSITPEHGVSTAGQTLAHMREAGYAPQAWEKAASIYAGWDIDGTPSIQTRIFSALDHGSASDVTIWIARITATRTVQEAWAAYLAYEDAGQSPSPGVHLAILERLYAEEKRLHILRVKPDPVDDIWKTESEPLLPGDVLEIAAPPSSTHLHTYTRTPPPTVLEFFELLEARQIVLSHHCLAFIIEHAASLQLGFRYLQHGQQAHPAIKTLLSSTQKQDVHGMPDAVLTAVIRLLCRFSGVSLIKTLASDELHTIVSSKASLNHRSLNPYHTIVCALAILRSQAPVTRSAYNSVLHSLCEEHTHASMRYIIDVRERGEPLDQEDQELEKGRDHLNVYRLVDRTLALMDAVDIMPDALAVFYLCWTVENFAIATWKIVKQRQNRNLMTYAGLYNADTDTTAFDEVETWLRRGAPLQRVKREFSGLVGGHSSAESGVPLRADDNATLPRLLDVPHPWLLHAYVRALGWMGDYEALIKTMEWMIRHRDELTIQMTEDRNGKALMKKVCVALRVFLERSWLTGSSMDTRAAQAAASQASDGAHDHLRHFESPASTSIVEKMRELVGSADEWPDWPTDEEVELYCQDRRFKDMRKLYE